MDIKQEIERSFIEINDDNDSDPIEKDLIMKILETFLNNQDLKDDRALTNLIISELENFSKNSDD